MGSAWQVGLHDKGDTGYAAMRPRTLEKNVNLHLCPGKTVGRLQNQVGLRASGVGSVTDAKYT